MEPVLFSTPDNPIPENRAEGFFETHDGHRLRYAVFRSDAPVAKGTVVLLQGRNEYIEKYFETIRDLTASGLWVATFDLRGQGGSDRLLKNRQYGHVRRFIDYEHDLDTFLEKIVLPDTRLPFFILAHSTGALIAMSAALYLSTRIERMVLTAPFIGLSGQAASEGTIRALAGVACSLGLGLVSADAQAQGTAVPRQPSDIGPDAVRAQRWCCRGPSGIGRSGPRRHAGCTISFPTIDRVTSPNHLFSITIPTVVIAPTRDEIVPYIAQERISRHFRAAQFVLINGARHEVLQERDRLPQGCARSLSRLHSR